jgi:hypothetical protein
MTTDGEWCARCRHYIVPARHHRGTWVHYSDDDWSHPALPGVQDCECAYMLLPCTPPGLPARTLADLAEGFRSLSRSARGASVSYTGLAAALPQKDPP